MEKILQSYLRRLTNLSGNNRSLLLLRLISDQFLDLHELDFSNSNPSFQIIKDIIAKKDEIKISNEIDPRDSQSNTTSQKLRKIHRIENFIFEERGAKDLYIGWPFVRGKFNDGTLVRCPLIFFPVSLSRDQNGWYLKQRKEVNITLNKTFLLAYAYYNQVSLDEDLIEYVLNDLERDSTVYRTQLYELLKASNVEINFNQENFIDQLQSFKNYKKSEFEGKEKPGQLKIFPEAVLGIFPQAGSYLVPDYVKLLEKETFDDLEPFFMKKIKSDPEDSSAIRFSDKVKEETTFTPFPIDASQEYALNLIKNGNSLVVQGPPGTGKSQLICNLISDFIGRGKNVLVVCQKKAALDVVYQRLQSQQLHDFIGLVHDFKNDRKSTFDQIAHQVDSLDDYRQKNNSLDAIYLERKFLQSSRKIDQLTEELGEFKLALFDDQECGKSIKELYLTSDPNEPSIHLNQEYRSFHYKDVSEFLIHLNQYLDYHKKFEDTDNFWVKGPSFSTFTNQDYIRIREIFDELPEFHERLKKESKIFSKTELDFEACLHFLSHLEDLAHLKTNLDNEKVFAYYKHMLNHKPSEDPLWLSTFEGTLLQCFKGYGLETSLAAKDLGRFQEALEHAIKARKGLFSWIKWKLFSEDKIFITRILVANDLKSNKEGFEILLKRIDNRLNYEHILSKILDTKWLKEFPNNFRKIDIQNWFFYQKLGLKCIQVTRKTRLLNQVLSAKDQNRTSFMEGLTQFMNFLDRIPLQLQLWARYISESQIRSLLLGKEDIQTINNALKEDFDSIVEYDKLKDNFTSTQNKILNELFEKSEEKDEIITIFENSLAISWIDHIETKYPILRSISSYKLDHLTKELQEAILDKTNTSQEILLLKSRERTYENLEYNRLNNLVTYKDLYHQVTKKRKVWPIRKVLSSFKEEVFTLLPCWMASPESASAMFPMEEMFDLVIFDEASQCFAERGIPAMYRGKQVVIAGDDKQLQPNDLYRVRWEEDDDQDLPELEIDSLLNLSKQYLKEVSLRGHYRSKSLELIEFSNINFYKGKLKLLPDFKLINQQQPPIHYIKIEGTWKNNTNQEEAEEVVKIIQKIYKDTPEKSIGVVTFNARQQGYILDRIEYYQDDGMQLPASLFVKNIENVQGDERDIIIFSTAYGPDEKGNLQLRFGSLNVAGGENRLNVAITRAKESIYMVTSLLPHQLNTDKTSNPGPKLLRAYLQYAWDVSQGDWIPNSQEDETQVQSWYLRNKITREKNEIQLKKELPFSDLTVISGKEYKGLVLTDDDLFYDTLSPKEAYSYRQSHFIEKNWPFIQFYSREYWMDQQKTEEKLNKFITRIVD